MIGIAAFIIVTSIIVMDFGISGASILSMSRQAKERDRAFIRGIGFLFLLVAAINLFWLVIVLAGEFTTLLRTPWVRQVAIAFILVIEIASVIGRRRWWNRLHQMTNGHSSDE